MNTTACFSDIQLRRYALGDCDDAVRERIEEHLERCPQCEETLAALDDTADSLVRHLPLVAAAATSAASAENRPGWLERLGGGPPPASDSPDFAASPADEQPHAPSPYELLGIVGRGGMGIVYRARHRQLGRLVAFKVLDPRLTAAVEARRRFDREIRILGNLQHSGIVMATDAGRIGSAAYLVMELVDGGDLARLVRRGGPLTVAEACEAGRQIALALSAAHRAGVVHRDLKPSNVMADRGGRIKLLDFGLSQLAPLAGDSAETSLGRLLGTLAYMAPEQAASASAIDYRADLYGLGGTLFFLLTGRPPRDARGQRSLVDQLRAVTDNAAPPIRSLRADIPEKLAELIDRLLHVDPAERGESAEAVAEQLERWAGGDLAHRVGELAEPSHEPVAESREEAERSLAHLLAAGNSAAASVDPAAQASRFGEPRASFGGIFRRGMWISSLAAGAAALWFGLTLLIKTPEGTLRIESEVEDVRVEVVDEQDQVQQLTIDREQQETRLRAGRYRIRLAEPYDHLEITPSVITLQRGGQQIARITRAETADTAAMVEPVERDEPLYQGEPAAVWQRRFDAERAPQAKLEAAVALLTLAGELPEELRLERLVEIGAALIESAWGDRYWEPALQQLGRAGEVAPRWDITKQHSKPWHEVTTLLHNQLGRLPPERLAERLGEILLEDPPRRAALAARMLAGFSLTWSSHSDLARDPRSRRRLLERLDVPVEGLGRTAIAALVAASLNDRATEPQRERIAARMNELAAQLIDAPEDELRSRMRTAWLIWAGRDIGVDAHLAATLLYDMLVRFPSRALYSHFEFRSFSAEYPHGSLGIERLRESGAHFLPQWIAVVNRHLQQAADADLPDDPVTDAVIRSLDYVLHVRRPEDDWDVASTARLLIERLRRMHHSDRLDPGDQPSTTPAQLLTQIVWIEGAIPEFAKTAPPAIEESLELWDRILESGSTDPPERRRLQSLIVSAPYRAVELLVEPRRQFEPRRTLSALEWISPPEAFGLQGRIEVPPLDALLLLTILADLTGRSAEQDKRIAVFLNEPHPERTFRRHLRDLLGRPTALAEIARGLLDRIAEQAIDASLREAAEAAAGVPNRHQAEGR